MKNVFPDDGCTIWEPPYRFRDIAHVDRYYGGICARWRKRPGALARAMHRYWRREWESALRTV